jgi:hypothetical protein
VLTAASARILDLIHIEVSRLDGRCCLKQDIKSDGGPSTSEVPSNNVKKTPAPGPDASANAAVAISESKGYTEFKTELADGLFSRVGSACLEPKKGEQPLWVPAKVKLDTQGDINLVSRPLLKRMTESQLPEMKVPSINVKGIGGYATYNEAITLHWTITRLGRVVKDKFYVSDDASIDLLVSKFAITEHGLLQVNYSVYIADKHLFSVDRPKGKPSFRDTLHSIRIEGLIN